MDQLAARARVAARWWITLAARRWITSAAPALGSGSSGGPALGRREPEEWISLAAPRVDQFGRPLTEVARLFGVGTATVTRLRRLHRDGAGLAPRSTVGGRVSKRTKERLDVLAELVREQPDRYGRELAELWTNAVGVSMTRSDVVRGLRDLRLTLKKSRSKRLKATRSG